MALRSLDAMLEINAIVLYARLGSTSTNSASQPPVSDLFELAQPRPRLYGEVEYTKAAKALQSRLTRLKEMNRMKRW